MTFMVEVEAAFRTDQGQVRDHNEDFVTRWEPESSEDEAKNGWLYIVADGVGGADAGEVASRFASERAIQHYLHSEESEWGKRLQTALQAANADLRQLVSDRESNMATTMVAAVIHDSQATMANVGDSRGYHWRAGVMRQVTKDQSLVAKLVEEGAITEEEAINHPRKNVILHSLGSRHTPQIDVFEFGLEPGDLLILCSDGLTRHVSDDEIGEIVAAQLPAEASETLVDMANERGGEDNISVAILRYTPVDAPTLVRAPAGHGASAPTQVSLAKTRKMKVDRRAARRALWVYTALLCVAQTTAIFLLWFLLT